jgi:hypothetical protein
MQRKQILSLVMIAIATAGATRALADDPIDRDASSSEDVAMTTTRP